MFVVPFPCVTDTKLQEVNSLGGLSLIVTSNASAPPIFSAVILNVTSSPASALFKLPPDILPLVVAIILLSIVISGAKI